MEIKKENVDQKDNSTGRLVWAKMRTHPYWPAKIVSTPPMMGKTPENYACVLFFGTKNFGFVSSNSIFDYIEHRNRYATATKTRAFKIALNDMDNYMLDPVKYQNNAFVVPKDAKIKKEPVNNQITVKGQRNIDIDIRIKADPADIDQVADATNFPLAEKQKLINKIIELRSDNERFVENLKRTETKCEKLACENGALTAELHTLSAKIDDLRSKLSACASKQSDDSKTIANLLREKRSLEAIAKQCKAGLAVSEKNEDNNSEKSTNNESSDEYEVEKIIAHKKKKDGMHYLVRWKGYDQSQDTWEREANLHCPRIMEKYRLP